MNLGELIATLDSKLVGRAAEFSWINRRDGSQIAAVKVGGKLFATWKAELANDPVFDGVTPRGEKTYSSLQFFDGEPKS